jgi:hypothetical protein
MKTKRIGHQKTDNYFLDLHKRLLESGELSCRNGLCNEVGSRYGHKLNLFEPSITDEEQLEHEGLCTVYWGSGLSIDEKSSIKDTAYTPLRQTIVLFCHEILNS